MAVYTEYVGNWRGVLEGSVLSYDGDQSTVTLNASIGRKGTGTLNDASFTVKFGTSAGGNQIGTASGSLNKDGWTSSGQERIFSSWPVAGAITRTKVTQTKTYYGSFRYKSGSTTSNYYNTPALTVTIPAKDQYTIQFYPGDGGTGIVSKTKWYGEDITAPSPIGTKAGWSFEYWYGGGSRYYPGDTYSKNGNASLGSKWHQHPTCTATVASSGYYYAGVSHYKVTITNATAYDDAGISSIKLTVGSQTATLTGNGTFDITLSTAGTFQPTVVITDGQSKTRSYTLASVTVLANTQPTCTASVTSSGNYYSSLTTYSVNITGATAYNNKTISSIVLKVGTATAFRTTNGSLSVTVPAVSTTTSYTPTVVITDNIGASKTISLTAISVRANTVPTCTATVASSGYYYAGASTYTVNIANATAYEAKTISSIVLTVGSQTTSRTNNGALSIALNTAGTFTPTVVIKDNIGASKTYTLSALTVYANTAPTFNAATSTSGNYYVGLTNYSVSISNVSAKNNKTIAQTKLTIGSQTVTGSGNGTLTIKVGAAGTFTPTVTVTDSMGVTATWSAASLLVRPNTAPSATVTLNDQSPYYVGVSARGYKVTLSSVTAYEAKTITQTNLTVGSQTATGTGNGALSITLNTAGTFTPVVTVKDNQGAVFTKSLAAITVNTPQIAVEITKTDRVTASSTATSAVIDDEGTNAVITAKFSYSKFTGNYLTQPTIAINGTATSAVTWYTAWSSAGVLSGAVNWTSYQPGSPITLYGKLTSTLSISTTYTIAITPKTTVKTGTAVSSNVSQAFYLLAGKAGGHALGIGKKPSSDGILDVGMGAVRLNNYNGATPAIEYQGSKANYKMIKFKDNTADTYGNGIVIGGGGLVVIGGGESSDAVAATYNSGGDEELALTSDGNIKFWTSVQNGAASAHTETIDANGIYSGRAANLYIPRAGNANTIDLNSVPSQYFGKTAEYGPSCLNLPSSAWYFVTTLRGADNNYCVQLALGETANDAYYRVQSNTSWQAWRSIVANNAVTQTATSTNADYELLFSATADNTTRTEGARKHSTLTVNPSTGIMKTTGFIDQGSMLTRINSAVTKAEITAQDSSLTTSSADSAWLNALLKALVVKYPNRSATLYIGKLDPNSSGWYEVYIYDTAVVSNGYPQHSYGRYMKYGGTFYKFGTNSYSPYTTAVDTNTTYSSQAAASGGTAVSLVTTGEKYTWNNKANGNHTHTLAMATSSGTNAITLAASTKYQLTAGGSTYIFTTPPNTTYSSQAAASGGTAVSLVTTGEKYTWNAKQAALSVVDLKSQITTGISGLTVVAAKKYGNVCHIEFNYNKSTAVASGADAFSANLTTLPYKPAADVQGVGYYGARAFVCWLTTAGKMTLRNAGSSSATPSSSGGLYFSVTYICA